MLVSHVPHYVLKLCVRRVLVSHVQQYILKVCVLRVLVSHVLTRSTQSFKIYCGT
jgi:DNA-directed RNA polymerase subunit N (RpoN/RPB10)